jgi:hypothetical protein
MLQDFRNFEQNKPALSDKMFELPFAKFLDAITFGLFGFSQGVEDEISELKEKLDITFNDLAGALGMSIEDIMGSLEDAFSEDTYEGFLKSFTTSLEEMTRQALIRAFLSEAIQPIIEDYVKAFIEMYEAGTLSPEEVAKWREKLESAIDSSGLEEFFNVIQDYFDDMSGYGSEFSGADAISRSITEETGNRLAALLTTINMHVASIDQFLENGILTVRVVNQETSSRNDEDSLAAMGV